MPESAVNGDRLALPFLDTFLYLLMLWIYLNNQAICLSKTHAKTFLAKCGPPPFNAGVEFRVGDRIKFSDIDSQRDPRLAQNRHCNERAIHRHSITVRFDGNRLKISLHRAYIQPISPKAPNANRV
jgi:hypothetical protein